MSPEQQIDRSVLAGKDRDELHTIAGAIGVKAATRMRKADLIDAILDAANGGEATKSPTNTDTAATATDTSATTSTTSTTSTTATTTATTTSTAPPTGPAIVLSSKIPHDAKFGSLNGINTNMGKLAAIQMRNAAKNLISPCRRTSSGPCTPWR